MESEQREPAQRVNVATVVGALAIATLQYGVAVSLAALVFAGPLTESAGRASSGFILGTALVALVVGVFTRMSVIVAGAQDTAAIVAAAIAASIVATPGLDPESLASTVFVMLAIGALLTGGSMWMVGRFGLSGIVRFLPSPVVSGFVAGTGWLLFRGGIEVAQGEALEWGMLPEQVSWERVQFLLPALALGLFMVLCMATRLNNAWMSVAILAGAVAFHLVGRSVSTIEDLETEGWLIGPFPAESGWSPITPGDLGAADWGVLAGQALPIVALVAVSLVGFLLNLTGLEPLLGEEIDLEHELRVTGPVNLAVGASGGLIGYALIGDTALADNLGLKGRVTPLIVAVIGLGLVIAGPDLVGLLPRAVAGGVLIGLGVSVLVGWVRSSLPRMDRVDRILSWLILLVIALAGVLPGVGLGLIVAALIFVINQSRISPVHHISSGTGRSNVDRAPEAAALLAVSADRITTMELRGYLFFGSVTRLRGLVDDRLGIGADDELDGEPGPRRWLVLDFQRVQGLDSTAAAAIAGIATRLADHQVSLVLSCVNDEVREALDHNRDGESPTVTPHRDLDHAVEWCEDQILAEGPSGEQATPPELPPAVRDAMEPHDLAAGQTLISAGETNRDLYFVDAGTLTAWSPSSDAQSGAPRRLRQVQPGAILGEIAFVTGAPRTANVIADTAAQVRVLRYDRLTELAQSDPEAGLAFQHYLLQTLARRLNATNAAVHDLTR